MSADAHWADAAELLSRCVEDSLELSAGAIFGPSGEQLFATDDGEWGEGVEKLWRLAGSPGRDVAYLHVGTEDGDVLGVRSAAGSALVTSSRFPLASLVLSDLRAVVRGLADGNAQG